MKKFVLIGYPLGHSVSPFIHKELFKLKNIDAEYSLEEIAPEEIESRIPMLWELDGFNVTIPHKTDIIGFTNKLSEKAKLFSSVNTVKNQNGSLIGYNTDCHGFLRSLETAEIELGKKVIVCGSGGVSRMFAFEGVLAGAELTIAVRESGLNSAEKIKSEIKSKLKKDISVCTLEDTSGECDLLINATPVGMYPNTQSCILPEEKIRNAKAVFDAVYNPLETRLITTAKKNNIKCVNGLPMLVWQAAAAQEIWLDVKFSHKEISRIIKITERSLAER